MSAIVKHDLQCDVPECGAVLLAESVNAPAARAVAKHVGWHRHSGRDVCPDCWTANGPGRLGWRYSQRDGWTVG